MGSSITLRLKFCKPGGRYLPVAYPIHKKEKEKANIDVVPISYEPKYHIYKDAVINNTQLFKVACSH
jgi:hypothetical protein